MLAEAAWWLTNPRVVEEENEAAAAPATTTANAKMRIASFIFGYPIAKTIDREVSPTNTFMVVHISE
jgi:hypothetical protein